MCVNDLYTLGARPLWFLDYYATGKLDPIQFKSVLTGIQKSVKHCGALLLGGETAEMPGLYGKGHFDLAGFVVGVVDGKKMLGPKNVKNGDALISLASSGFHSNGYSLIRKWLSEKPGSPELLKSLMTPTRLYSEIPDLLDQVGTDVFHALANITGGGISGNLPRVLPPWAKAKIDLNSIPTPPWMKEFMASHGSTPASLEAVFNLGCGMIAVVDSEKSLEFLSKAKSLGLNCQSIGSIERDESQNEATITFL
jgi:phosphoribosylaminoimidazole synthetase